MANKDQLIQLWAKLNEQEQQSLLDYAAFLEQRDSSTEAVPQQPETPQHIEAPEGESVIAAIKRLKISYFMLNTDPMLNETSAFMAQFMMQGRSAEDIIVDLEKMFEKYYQQYLEGFS